MKNRKIVAVILATLLLVSCFSTVISAETSGAANFTVGSAEAKAGESVTVVVTGENCPDAKALVLVLKYDTNALELDVNNSAWLIPNPDMARVGDTCMLALSAPASFNGDVLKLTFKVKANASAGEYPIEVQTISCMLDTEHIAVVATAGKIVVSNDSSVTVENKSAIPGDTVSVKVALANTPQAKAIMVTLTYPDGLEFDAVNSAWLVENPELQDTGERYANTCLLSVSGATDFNGNVLELVFKVKEDAAPAVCEVKADVKMMNGTDTVFEGSAVGKITVNGESSKTATLSSGKVNAGESVELVVSVDRLEVVRSMYFTLTYDSSVLEFNSEKSAWLVSGSPLKINPTNGICGFGTATVVEGDVLKLVFDVKADAVECEIPVTCNLRVRDGQQDLDIKNVPGTVTVSPAVLRGDVNGDGKVDYQDALYLLRHTIDKEQYPINQSGDMDGKDGVNYNDALYLLRHTLDKETYPLS